MIVKQSMIDKELRATGTFIKLINNTFTENRFIFFNKLTRKFKHKMIDSAIGTEIKWIDRPDGTKLRLCIFRPLVPKADVPGILWLHGGGYGLGVPELSIAMFKSLIEASDCVVVAPDYRLSVEAPYPAALEDSYLALLWMKEHIETLGIRENQLMVGGESAGGGLTAALTLYARDRGDVAIAFQMPLYPMIDDRMDTVSAVNNNAPVWNSKSNYNSWSLYLGELFKTNNVPYYAAPARALDYTYLPPTVTFVGELEPFRDETIAYVKKLKEAGCKVDFKIYEGCYHGFDIVCPKAKVSREAKEFLMQAFKYAVDHYFANQPTQKGNINDQSQSTK